MDSIPPDSNINLPSITPRPENLSKEEIQNVGYEWMDYEEAAALYNPDTLKEGWNTLENGEEIYFVKTPALGLWKVDEV